MLKSKIIKALSEIGYQTDHFTENALKNAIDYETDDRAKDILKLLCQNINIAKEKNFPLCQDTGSVIFWVKVFFKKNLKIFNSKFFILNSILNDAVNIAFKNNNYRASIVNDPIKRKNTTDNTPPIIHYEFIPLKEYKKSSSSIKACKSSSSYKACKSSSSCKACLVKTKKVKKKNYPLSIIHYPFSVANYLDISIMLKGGGSENMSALKMLKPADGIKGIRDFVLKVVKEAGGNACPPLTVGIGIGGNFETCALLAKKSLFREHDKKNPDPFWAIEEDYLLNEINKLGIGPLGLGGNTTALKVNIEVKPCHIASLPVAVNLECHAHRVISNLIKNNKLIY